MSAIECSCDDPTFGHLGRPNCVIVQKALAFPTFSPRNRDNGNRNFIPANAAGIALFNTEYGQSLTTLKECIDYRLAASTPALDRLYPSLRVENAQFARTDTVYETAPSGRKIKIDGVGGVRTWSFELWGKDGCNGVARAYQDFGCSDIDAYYVDVSGNNWGIMDAPTNGKVRGYEVDTETFESIISFATDTTTQKLMVSFDIDNYECEENAWAITAEEYTEKFTVIRPLIQGVSYLDTAGSTLVAASPIVIDVELSASFGSAGNKRDITGLTTNSFVLLTSAGATQEDAGDWTSVAESPDGTYLLTTSSSPAAGTYTLVSTGAGYFIPNVTVTVA